MAREEAIRLQHDYVGTEHILLGLIREGEGVAAAVLTNLSVDLEQVQERIEESVRRGKATIALGELPYTSRAKKVLEFAMAEARELNHSYVGTEHLLLGLLREEKGIAAEVLNQLGVTLEEARRQTLKLLGSEPNAAQASPTSPSASSGTPKGEKKSKTPALDHFCRDLTELARNGDLDPTIGRAEEIERVMEILSRRKKNNPVLIGEPGVGKTAIVEGLAQLIASGTSPREPPRQPGAGARHGRGDRRHEVPGPVRGAAQGGHERDRAEQERHPLHRRAPHAGGRRRGRGRDRRLQHAQARPGPRRAAVRGRLDAERVPQVHREGRGAGAPLPDRGGRSAHRGGDGPDHPGAQDALRGAPPHRHHRRGDRGFGEARGALHHRPVPAGQGDRRHRRGRCARPAGHPGAAARGGGHEGAAGRHRRAEGRGDPRPGLRARGRAPGPRARAAAEDLRAGARLGGGAPHASPDAHRGRRRLHRVAVDGDPRDAAEAGRDGAPHQHGGGAPQAGRRARTRRSRPSRGPSVARAPG